MLRFLLACKENCRERRGCSSFPGIHLLAWLQSSLGVVHLRPGVSGCDADVLILNINQMQRQQCNSNGATSRQRHGSLTLASLLAVMGLR